MLSIIADCPEQAYHSVIYSAGCIRLLGWFLFNIDMKDDQSWWEIGWSWIQDDPRWEHVGGHINWDQPELQTSSLDNVSRIQYETCWPFVALGMFLCITENVWQHKIFVF